MIHFQGLSRSGPSLIARKSIFALLLHHNRLLNTCSHEFFVVRRGKQGKLRISSTAARNMSTHTHKDSPPHELETHETNETNETHGKHEKHEEHSHSHSMFHSHTHSHGGSNELLLAAQKEGIFKNPAIRITWIGLLVNIGMAASKGVGGVYFHSQALIADAIHSVSDMVADFLTLATVNVSNKIGTPTRFPLGYGKLETIGSLLVSGVLLFAGVSVGWSSLLQIFEFALPTYIYEYASMIQIGHSHSHGSITADHGHHGGHSHSHSPVSDQISVDIPTPSIAGAWLAGGSILVKELLYRKTMKVAVETNSKVLIANAWHHRVDSLTSMVALFTISGSYLFNVAWLDSIGGLFVSILIIRTGWSSFKSAWFELIDRGELETSETYIKIKDIANDEVNEVTNNGFEISKLSVMTQGANSTVYMTLLEKDSKEYTLTELNAIELKLIRAIKKDDKFIKNIFILFKSKSAQKKEIN